MAWNWEKHPNGKIELWEPQHTISVAIGTAMGTLYRSADTVVNYPFSLAKVLNITVMANDGNAIADLVSFNLTSLTYHLIYPGSVSASARNSFLKIEGTWK